MQITDSELWFIFGIHENGFCDIGNRDRDVITYIPSDIAHKIIEAHNSSLGKIEDSISIVYQK